MKPQPTNDGVALKLSKHKFVWMKPWWKSIYYMFRRPKLSRDNLLHTTNPYLTDKYRQAMLDSGIVHFCTENPCPVEEQERINLLKNGFDTHYTP